ncbi:tyramine oxidase [Aestuariivirga litoralis]|uniref:copper amine oxidase n=1 Tax=Aestuariivirga litoralis TaxID=2650924 RepID=UPI0018C62A27|nr:tyramine oxidase [Aestuariivirga litoralis]
MTKRAPLALMILLCLAGLAFSAPAVPDKKGPFGPLDALTPDEITLAVKILTDSKNADANTVYPAVTLMPGEKDVMRAWKPGTPFTRSAFVVLRRNLITYEAVIDLSAKKLVSFTPKPAAQPMIMDFEWDKGRDAFIADPRYKAALEKRKLKEADVFCTPNSAGYFPGDGLDGKRVVKIPCFVKDNGISAVAARPVEGLMGIVDTDSGQVLDVIDNGVVDMPPMPAGYSDADPKLGPALKPIAIMAPQGTNIQVSGNLDIKWANWSLHARADKRAGLILNLIRFQDGARLRDVAYQLNLSEIFVPYMDPDPTWSYRTFMDAGEFGIGYQISSLRPGVDCPLASYYFDLTFPNDIGGTYTRPTALCVFERATGDPSWRHYTAADQYVNGIPQTEMVVRHVATLGNYDYLIDYVFTPQGNITMKVGATGFDAIKGTAVKDMDDPNAAEATKYGNLIAPYTIAPNHDHYFSFRMDLDVDGEKNALVRDSIMPAAIPNSKTRKSLWTVKSDRYAAEGPVAPEHGAAGETWRVINPNEKTGLKYNPGYLIDGAHSVTSVLDKADPPQYRAGFTAYALWATHYAADEQWSAGLYPNLATKDEGLPAFVAQKRSINNEDLVLWYTMGFRHVPRPEDYPILPTYWHEVTLRPSFFFDKDPSMTFNPGILAPPPAEKPSDKQPTKQPKKKP